MGSTLSAQEIGTSATRFGKRLQVFVKKFDSLFLFGKMLSLLWQNYYIIGLIFIVAKGHIFETKFNNLVTPIGTLP